MSFIYKILWPISVAIWLLLIIPYRECAPCLYDKRCRAISNPQPQSYPGIRPGSTRAAIISSTSRRTDSDNGRQQHVPPYPAPAAFSPYSNGNSMSSAEQIWRCRWYYRADVVRQNHLFRGQMRESRVVADLLSTFAWQPCFTATDVGLLCLTPYKLSKELRVFSHDWLLDHRHETRFCGTRQLCDTLSRQRY